MMNYSTIRTNLASDMSQSYELQQREHFKIPIYCLVIALSLVGNSLVIAVVYKNANHRMRTPNNYFVVSMAVGDALITVFNMVAQVILLVRGPSLLFSGVAAMTVCKIQAFMWAFLISWSTGSLSAIAVDRFLLVFVPLKQIITLRIARVVIAAIIIIGAVISWPLLNYFTITKHEGKTFCSVNMSSFDAFRVYLLFFFTAFVFFPLYTSFVLYTAISLKLWLRKSPGNQENRARMNRRIVIMLVIVVVLFLLCWMPVSTIYFGCLAYPSENMCSILLNSDAQFTIWFVAYSNSAINPYVYFIFNENFRHGAKVIWSSIRGCCPSSFNRHNRVCAVV